jgi:hypothetical protein
MNEDILRGLEYVKHYNEEIVKLSALTGKSYVWLRRKVQEWSAHTLHSPIEAARVCVHLASLNEKMPWDTSIPPE